MLDDDPEAARVVGETQVEHVTLAGQARGVDSAVHPPDEQLRVELVRQGVAEHPLGAPLRQAEDDRLEGPARGGQHVVRPRALDDAEALEMAQALGQQRARETRAGHARGR